MIRVLKIVRWIYAAFFFLIGTQALLASAGILPAAPRRKHLRMPYLQQALSGRSCRSPMLLPEY